MPERHPRVPPPTVSVVIPTYNRRAYVDRVLRPLLDDAAALEIVVVVDGSSDGTHEHLLDLARQHPRLRPVWQENAGRATARAAGLAVARGDLVLFLDDDVVASAGLVSGHAAAHATRERLVVVGYMPPALSLPRAADQAPTYIYASDYERVCRAYEDDQQQILLNLWGGNVSIRRKDALEIGMSDLASVGYHEDKALGYRCAAAGLSGYFSRDLLATHLHQRSLERYRADLRQQADDRRYLAVAYAEPDAEASLVWHPTAFSARLVSLLSRPRMYPGVSALLVALYRLAGQARTWPVETLLARVIRQIDLEYHARLDTNPLLSRPLRK